MKRILAFLFVSLFPVSGLLAEKTENWNQFGEPLRSGISQGYLKMAFGMQYSRALDKNSYYIGPKWEYFATDRMGIILDAGIPVSSGLVSTKSYPVIMGLNVHLFPRFPVNLFVGGRGGITYLKPSGKLERFAPTAGLAGGLTLYYWGNFFMEIEGSYLMYQYATGSSYQDHSSPRAMIHTGIYF